jgi:Ca2+-binding EF-hand superfamily protein
MGAVLARAEVVRGLEAFTVIDVSQARHIFNHYEEVCALPALWERSFNEIFGCFKSVDACSRAFQVLDTDNNGFIDARETIGALAIVSRGHLTDRMALLYDIFDLNKEKEMAFDECFLMLRRTLGGLRKVVNIHIPPEKVVHNMVKQIWKLGGKQKDLTIGHVDWYKWWSHDASCRNGLKMFVWKNEDQRGLPQPDQYSNIDYTKGNIEIEETCNTQGVSRNSHRKASFSAICGEDGTVSRPTRFEDDSQIGLPEMDDTLTATSARNTKLAVPRRKSS